MTTVEVVRELSKDQRIGSIERALAVFDAFIGMWLIYTDDRAIQFHTRFIQEVAGFMPLESWGASLILASILRIHGLKKPDKHYRSIGTLWVSFFYLLAFINFASYRWHELATPILLALVLQNAYVFIGRAVIPRDSRIPI